MRLASLLALSGCWVTSDQIGEKLGAADTAVDADTDTDADADADADTDVDTDTDVDVPDLRLLSIDPDYGTTAGGTRVQLVVEGLSGEVPEVRFGGELAAVDAVDGPVVEVTAPALDVTGWAEVEVRAGGGEAVVPEGFHVWTEGAGLVGALGAVAWVEVVGDYWSDNPEDYGWAWFGMVEPTALTYRELYTDAADDACLPRDDGTVGVDYLDMAAEVVTLSSGGSDVVLPYSKDLGRYDADLLEDVVSWGSRYTLGAFSEAREWAMYDGAVDVLEAPTPLRLTAPEIDGASLPWVQRNTALSWEAAGGSYLIAVLTRYHDDVLADELVCIFEDDGSHVIPSDTWSGWSTNDTIYISIGRVQEVNTALPHNGARSGAVGAHWLSGAARATGG